MFSWIGSNVRFPVHTEFCHNKRYTQLIWLVCWTLAKYSTISLNAYSRSVRGCVRVFIVTFSHVLPFQIRFSHHFRLILLNFFSFYSNLKWLLSCRKWYLFENTIFLYIFVILYFKLYFNQKNMDAWQKWFAAINSKFLFFKFYLQNFYICVL